MQARLKVLHDKANVKQVKLLPVTLIGRSTDCNLKIASSQVSRNHCRITLGEDSVFVEDLGSANGTLVDGELLTAHQPTAISPGAHLIIGPAEFQIDYVASTSTTFVLPRSAAPRVPDLSSTEMIFPTAQFPAPPVSPVPPPITTPTAAAPAASVPTVDGQPRPDAPQIPVAPHPVAVAALVAQAPVASVPESAEAEPLVSDEATFVAPAVPIPSAVIPPTVIPAAIAPQAQQSEAESPAPAMGFNFPQAAGEAVDEPVEESQFQFQETVPDVVSPAACSPADASDQAPKKGGLKSLFSVFGRKGKQAASPATHTASVAESATAAPSVFLPTVEAQAASLPVEEFDSGSAHAGDTAEVTGEQPSQTSTDEDDGFQQFLSNF